MLKFALSALVAFAMFSPTSSVAQTAEEAPLDLSILENEEANEVVYGAEESPVRIVEYASLSCSHCKTFYDQVFSVLRKDYIDNNKITFVYRHFPLNIQAFRTAQIASCTDDPKRRQAFIAAFFKSQSDWAYETDEQSFLKKVNTIAKIGGMSEAEIAACFENAEIEKSLLEAQMKASEGLKVTGTPAIFFNGEFVQGHERSAEALKARIDAILAEQQ